MGRTQALTFRSPLLMAEDGQRQGRTESEAPRMLRDQRMEACSPIPGGGGGISRGQKGS